jgi:ribosome-binding factor A
VGQVSRTARLNELVREIVAEELGRIEDDRLELVSVTGVVVDADLNRAVVYFDSMAGPGGDDETLDALAARRVRLQAAIGRQVRTRRTPVLEFRPDEGIRAGERIDDILRTTSLVSRQDGGEEPDHPA